MPHCRICNQHKPESEFYKDKTRSCGYGSKCKKCHNHVRSEQRKRVDVDKSRVLYFKEYKVKNKIKLQEQSKSLRYKTKEYINKAKEKCIICGYDKCKDALDFHHVKGKDANISTITSLPKAIEEISKCIVVCSNCHREIHSGMHKEIDDLQRAINDHGGIHPSLFK